MNRDVLTKGDDCFALVIDPYNDNRSGYGFWTNPLGTQTDFRINDDGRNIDVNWDTEWKTASTVHTPGDGPLRWPFPSKAFNSSRVSIPGE